MKNKLFILSYGGAIAMLILLMGLGALQIHSNYLKYGSSYEVITIIGGEETRTTYSLSMNLAFIIFLMWLSYLLFLPLIDHINHERRSTALT